MTTARPVVPPDVPPVALLVVLPVAPLGAPSDALLVVAN